MQRHLKKGDLEKFLREDPHGREYLGALRSLTKEIPKLMTTQNQELDFVIEKFHSVTEVITLQQQFIGELGTENVVSISSVLADVVKMCQSPIEQRNIELKETLKA